MLSQEDGYVGCRDYYFGLIDNNKQKVSRSVTYMTSECIHEVVLPSLVSTD